MSHAGEWWQLKTKPNQGFYPTHITIPGCEFGKSAAGSHFWQLDSIAQVASLNSVTTLK